MAAVIAQRDVENVLRPWLGSYVVNLSPIAPEAAHLLRSYAPYREDFEGLHKRLESFLFNALHQILGSSMTVTRDDGAIARIYVADLAYIADDLMGVLFDSLSVYSVNFEALKAHSMQTGSLNAMRVLYQKYDAFQPPEEKELIARVIRENHPKWRYAHWLEDV